MFVIRRESDGRFVMDVHAKRGRMYTRELELARRWHSLADARADCFNAGRETVVAVADLERRT